MYFLLGAFLASAVAAAAGAAETPSATAMHVIDFNGGRPPPPWTAKLTGKGKEFKQPDRAVGGVKGWRAHVGGERAALEFSLGVAADAGASGEAGDHAARLAVARAQVKGGFWYSLCRWSLPPLAAPPPDGAGAPDLSALSLTADVKAEPGTNFTLTLRLNRQQSFAFDGAGTGDWQTVGGSLDRAKASWKDRPAPFRKGDSFPTARS